MTWQVEKIIMVVFKLSFITHICLLTLDIIYSFNACIIVFWLLAYHDKEVDVFLKILDHDMSTTSSYAAFHDSKALQTFHLKDNQYGSIDFLFY